MFLALVCLGVGPKVILKRKPCTISRMLSRNIWLRWLIQLRARMCGKLILLCEYAENSRR